MRSIRGKRLLAALVVAGTCGLVGAQGVEDDSERRPAAEAIPILAQRLVDALPGNADVWRRYLSENVVFVTETGELATKAELLEGFAPFPEGLTGSIAVRNPRITEHGDWAIAVLDLHEEQSVYGQHIEVEYVTTQTWRREAGNWRLMAAHSLVRAKDPAPIAVDPHRLADYAGTYELEGKRRYVVERRGDGLFGGRDSTAMKALVPVGDNVFFESGSNLGILRIFVRSSKGAVDRMVQRRKFADTLWLRRPAEAPPPTRR